jgi:hypothetical protein
MSNKAVVAVSGSLTPEFWAVCYHLEKIAKFNDKHIFLTLEHKI